MPPEATSSSPVAPSRSAHASAWSGYQEAAERAGETIWQLDVAGVPLCLRVAGQALAGSLLPALATRRRQDPGPDGEATVCAWDSATAGARPPRSPFGRGSFLARDQVAGSGLDDVDVAYVVAWGLLATWDRRARRGAWWARDAQALPYWEPTAPFRFQLHWAMLEAGHAMVHAAVVGDERGGVLLVGPGGAGKSTAALACVEAGWRYVGDDYCVLVDGRPPTAHGLYGVGKLSPSSAAALDGLADAAIGHRPGDDKIVYDLATHRPHLMAGSLPLRAVVVPALGPRPVGPDPLPAAVAARAVGPSTLFQLPSTRPEALSRLARVLRRLPVFAVTFGPDRSQAVTVLDQVLDRAGGGAG